MYFIITVDTEADNQWARESTITLNNIPYLQRFQDLCCKYGFPVTYLVTYEVAESDEAVNLLKRFVAECGAEVGAHLHPWTNPPYDHNDLSWERSVHRFPHELERNLLRCKLESLTSLITSRFGVRPTSYRSGRWGFNGVVAVELIRLGYLVDCSVTPKLSWVSNLGDPQGRGGPDYRSAPACPYHLDLDDVNKPGPSSLLEVPLTTLFTTRLFAGGDQSRLAKWFLGLPDSQLKRLLNHMLFRMRTLRVFPNSRARMFRSILRAAEAECLPVLEFMIHSSELMPGGSPYAQSATEVERTYVLLERMLQLFQARGLQGVTLSAYAQKVD